MGVEKMAERCGVSGGRRGRYVFMEALFGISGLELYLPWRRKYIDWPCYLFSYGFYYVEGNVPEPRDLFVDGELYAIDSGGFQISRKGLTITQDQVYDFQMRNRPELIFPLDVPVLPPSSYSFRDWYREALRRTSNNVKWLIDNADPPRDIDLYAVLHPGPPDLMEKWYREAVVPLIETGLASGVAVGTLVPLTRGIYKKKIIILYPMAFLYEKGVKRIHLFGQGPSWIFIEALDYFDIISSDSHTHNITVGHGTVLSHYRGRILSHRLRDLDKPVYCPCPVCTDWRRRYGTALIRKWETYTTEVWNSLVVHNLFVVLSYMYNLALEARERTLAPTPDDERIFREAFVGGYRLFWRKYRSMFPPWIRESNTGHSHWF